jgi:putative transposase
VGTRKVYFSPDEWFHCFNRGVDKRRIFLDKNDHRRFIALLYACNSVKTIHISNYEQGFRSKRFAHVLNISRTGTLVDIGAYTLLPNHYHLLLRERVDGGVTSFMRKLGTAYTMYFNIKYKRAGALFQGAFKAKHVQTDSYFSRILNYIHGNHGVLYEPKWKEGIIKNEDELRALLIDYPYSSLADYYGAFRLESTVICKEAIFDVIDTLPSLYKVIEEAKTFARQQNDDF